MTYTIPHSSNIAKTFTMLEVFGLASKEGNDGKIEEVVSTDQNVTQSAPHMTSSEHLR